MGINSRLSDLNPIPTGHGRNQLIYERHVTKSGRDRVKGPGTSKLDWMYLEHKKIGRNELQICTNSQKGTGTKISEKLNNFEKFERKKKSNQISALFLTQRPPNDWPDTLDHLAIGLVANKCTKLQK